MRIFLSSTKIFPRLQVKEEVDLALRKHLTSMKR